MQKLTEPQEEQLRAVAAHARGVPVEELDGRTLRALANRGMLRQKGGRVVVTNGGDEWLRAQDSPTARPGRGSPASGRASMLRNAINRVATAVPPEAEIRVGLMFAHVQDVLAGLRRYARGVERDASPPGAARRSDGRGASSL